MKDIWQRIENWLALNAPQLAAGLQSGASDEEIQQTEATLNITFPEDIRESYRLHNGSTYEFLATPRDKYLCFRLFSLQEMIEINQMMKNIYFPPSDEPQYPDEPTDLDPADQEQEPSYEEVWRRELLGESEIVGKGGRDADDSFDQALIHFMVWSEEFYLCFDSSQDYNTFGMIIYYYISDTVYVRYSSSLRNLLSQFADDLEAGKCRLIHDNGVGVPYDPPEISYRKD
jgi:cell wall assembly regulator SMI1